VKAVTIGISNMTDINDFPRVFAEAFPCSGASRCCRVPGRVNLMGEHTDYNGLPVLPMAIDRAITAAWARRKDQCVVAASVDPAFQRVTFENAPDITPSPPGSWENYLKAAFVAINRHFKIAQPPGLDLLVSASIPYAAGLSSSSALVIAGGLAALDACGLRLGKDITRLELAALLADAEHYVGTRGGGMDHTVILNGQAGCACKIGFLPLHVERVPLPAEACLVVCHSGVRADKSGAMLDRYNEGPALSRLICVLVEKAARETFDDEIQLTCLGDLWYGPLCLTLGEVRALVQESIPGECVSLDWACRRLGLPENDLRALTIGSLPEPPGGFDLHARARHLLSEFERVERGRDCLVAGDLDAFGELMNASHESCAHDYKVSCPELDALTHAARQSGALGSRMTGAGFGGSTVSLVRRDDADRFCRDLASARPPAPSMPRVLLAPMPVDPAGPAEYLS
jgi:N-acetylgalactosamine kinase